MVKRLFEIVVVIVLAGCATKRSTPPAAPTLPTPSAPSAPVEAPPAPAVVSEAVPMKVAPRIGLIFSGGGAKAWAHIGVLKEIEKAKWPVQAVAGFEWGASVAAAYAQNLSANEAEWELSKVKNFEDLDEASAAMFGGKSAASLKVPFVCPSLNIVKQTIFLLNRGQLDKLIPFCVAQPPLSAVYSQSVAEMDHIAGLAQHLRSTGANKVVLINVLAQKNKRSLTPDYLSAENILWVKSAASMALKVPGVDDTIHIHLDNYGIKEIDKKREIIAKGAELGYDDVKFLTGKYGL